MKFILIAFLTLMPQSNILNKGTSNFLYLHLTAQTLNFKIIFLITSYPKKGIVYIKTLFNAIIRTSYIRSQWKLAQTIIIPEPGEPPNKVTSYRLISLLPITSKFFEKILLIQLKTPVSEDRLKPDYQFGFRNNHSTIEQVNRVCNVISNSIEKKYNCPAASLDIQQPLDKVWHPGLLYKIKTNLPRYFLLFQSYL